MAFSQIKDTDKVNLTVAQSCVSRNLGIIIYVRFNAKYLLGSDPGIKMKQTLQPGKSVHGTCICVFCCSDVCSIACKVNCALRRG